MVFEREGEHASPWAAISSIAAKIGCNPKMLRGWVRQAERDQGKRPGPTTDEQERITLLSSRCASQPASGAMARSSATMQPQILAAV